jgi:hypothetical protein
VRGVLGETGRLLATNLHLFTLVALTVWLPGHLMLNYLEFFGAPDDQSHQPLRIGFVLQAFFDPLVVAAVISALARVKSGLPATYVEIVLEGLRAWPRLIVVRLVIYAVVAVPLAVGLALSGPGRSSVAGGLLASVLAALVIVFLVRIAVIDSVVVLEGATLRTAWARAIELTRNRRGQIFGVMLVLIVLLISAVLALGLTFKLEPQLNHFVVRVLVDCVLTVLQLPFSIAGFLFYWRARG